MVEKLMRKSGGKEVGDDVQGSHEARRGGEDREPLRGAKKTAELGMQGILLVSHTRLSSGGLQHYMAFPVYAF